MKNKKSTLFINKATDIDLGNNLPILFNKKKKKVVIKPLNYISNDTGKSRHFTPAAQEWFNSIYTYNKNTTKLLPVADKNLMYLLKSYFNFQINTKLLKTKFSKTKPMATRYKRLSTKRVFIGRGELKHTSNKVIITFYVYNTEKKFLLGNTKELFNLLYKAKSPLEKIINKDRDNKDVITYNRVHTLSEFLTLPNHYEWYLSYITFFVKKFNNLLSIINTYYSNLTNLVDAKVLTEDEKLSMFNKKIVNVNTLNYIHFHNYKNKVKYDYEKYIWVCRYLWMFSKVKFTKKFMVKLTHLVENIYNKKVEFNIVNLKKMHLSSDIYTQAVALKLKNRDNKLYRVLKSSLRKIKLPDISKISEKLPKPNKDKIFVNRIRNNLINSMFTNIDGKDSLNNLLLDFFPSADNLKINVVKRSSAENRPISLNSYVLKYLKHLKIRGIRIEAKGRLTRRFTASRSVFKMKWKGGLKNVESSFRGLSAIMLRGYVKSNGQYSFINSKNRNGAFGVKGWVSSK